MSEHNSSKTLSAVITLAGFSTRMGSPKQHVKLGNHTFLETILTKLKQLSLFIGSFYFVGQQNDKKSQTMIENLARNGFKAFWLINNTPELGPLSSIRLALKNMPKQSSILLWPVDHPMVKTETVKQLILLWHNNPSFIAVPSVNFKRGHPTIFPGEMYEDFFNIPLEKGAKTLLQKYANKINYLNTEDIWVKKNLNTPNSLAEAKAALL